MGNETLGSKVKAIRERRGWTVYAACENTKSMGRTTLTRIEADGGSPSNIPFDTVIQLVDLYWPELQTKDFIEDSGLSRYTFTKRRGN